MLDDAFKMTLDVVYPALARDQLPEREGAPSQEHFPVAGYPDEQNLWGECFYQFRAPN